jgi:hypothetical protein
MKTPKTLRKILFSAFIIISLALINITCFDATRDNPFDPVNGGARGPIGLWDFEEIYTLPIGGNTVHDKSGNGNDGLIVEPNGGNPLQSSDVPTGLGHNYSLNFVQGTAARIYLIDNTLFNFPNTNSKFSVEFWIKLTNQTATDTAIVSKWGDNTMTPRYGGWVIGQRYSSNQIFIRITESGSVPAVAADILHIYSNLSVPINTWSHIACTIDIEHDIYFIYINGIKSSITFDPAGANTILNINLNSIPLSIGACNIPTEFTANGYYIDEVKIYNYIRSPAQISADAN